jgi:hypothetical protein
MRKGGESYLPQVKSRSNQCQSCLGSREGSAQPNLFEGCKNRRRFGAYPAPEPRQVTD